ncbi:hypothetical protein RJ641_030332 [Dillenia turbinata]|uniref:Uncharacterized protein n=1 Tax=Dillenia turbinata TaxID=194707 RepID=A0AAN8ZK33_9MAGN
METLVVVAQHKNQYYGNSKNHTPVNNCRRTFQYGAGAGILPTPTKICSSFPKQRSSISSLLSSPKTPLASVNYSDSDDENNKNCLETSNVVGSKSIAIPIKDKGRVRSFGDDRVGFGYSERWAGPAYSNSPPPSSLPIPKFHVRPKRTVSLNLPVSVDDIKVHHPIAKSAPSSPTREMYSSQKGFNLSTDFATKNLRRILNLDIADDE